MLTEDKVKELIEAALKAHAEANPGLTAEQVNSAINNAITARNKRDLEPLQATLNELKEAVTAKPPDPGKGKGKGGGDPEVAELKQLILKEREAREAAEEAQKAAARRGALVEGLTAAGVDKGMLEPAIALHLGRIEHTESGEIAYRGDDAVQPHGPIDAALKKWVESDVGKRFLPPRDAAGSGARGADGIGTTGEDGKTVYSDADLGNALLSM